MTRRDFIEDSAVGGVAFVAWAAGRSGSAAQTRRRRGACVSGKRVEGRSIYAHSRAGGRRPHEPEGDGPADMCSSVPAWIERAAGGASAPSTSRASTCRGAQHQSVSYKADREVAQKIILHPERELAEACAANPERFVAFATVALQFPDMATEQVELGVRSTASRRSHRGQREREELADPKYHPFWAKAEQLGVPRLHPSAGHGGDERDHTLQGQRVPRRRDRQSARDHHSALPPDLRGHAGQFPGLKMCAAHAGGFLPSYAGRWIRAA